MNYTLTIISSKERSNLQILQSNKKNIQTNLLPHIHPRHRIAPILKNIFAVE